MGIIKKIISVSLVILATICHAQNNDPLYDEIHFEDGLCKKDIVGTPIEIMRSTWTDTGCFHRKQPTSMLAIEYKDQDYALYIDYSLEEEMVDSIISWVDNHRPIEMSVLFFQSCAEPYVLNNKFYPLGIITHIRPYILDGKIESRGKAKIYERFR